MSKYKPGQLVTIDNTVYRIRSTKGTRLSSCMECAFCHMLPQPSISKCLECLENLGVYGYFEKVCGNMYQRVLPSKNISRSLSPTSIPKKVMG